MATTAYTRYEDFLSQYNLAGNADNTSIVPTVSLQEQNGKYVVTLLC